MKQHKILYKELNNMQKYMNQLIKMKNYHLLKLLILEMM